MALSKWVPHGIAIIIYTPFFFLGASWGVLMGFCMRNQSAPTPAARDEDNFDIVRLFPHQLDISSRVIPVRSSTDSPVKLSRPLMLSNPAAYKTHSHRHSNALVCKLTGDQTN